MTGHIYNFTGDCTKINVVVSYSGTIACSIYCDENCNYECCTPVNPVQGFSINAYYNGEGCGTAPCYCPGTYDIIWCH